MPVSFGAPFTVHEAFLKNEIASGRETIDRAAYQAKKGVRAQYLERGPADLHKKAVEDFHNYPMKVARKTPAVAETFHTMSGLDKISARKKLLLVAKESPSTIQQAMHEEIKS